MKKFNFNYLVSISIAAVVLSSCGGLNKMVKNAHLVKYSVTPSPLEMHADSVEINGSVKFPGKFFNKKAVVTATPVLKYTNGEKAFNSATVQGEAVEANNPIISFVDGGSITYSGKIPYIDDMKMSELEIRVKATVKGKDVDFEPYKLADGVIATPRLLQSDAKSIIGKDKFARITPDTYEADIHFLINRAEVRSTELRDKDIKELKAYVKEAIENENRVLKGVGISAYASPDGELDLNTGLAQKRAVSAEKYLGGEFKKAEEAKQEGFFSSASTPEDWEGFKKLMEESDVQDKDLILRVLSMYSDPVVREKEIKNISAAYTIIADKILPRLRRSMLNVNIDIVGKSDEELLALADTLPDTLNAEELLYAATLTKNLDKQLQFYQSFINKFPDDWRGNNNAGCAYLEQNKLSDAKNSFENAKNLDEANVIVLNNLGVVAFIDNDLEKALEYYTSAAGAGNEQSYNLGIISIKRAEYDEAITYFGTACSFNASLAKLLAGDNDGALKAIDCIEEQDDAIIYYLKAIIGARSDNSDLLYNNLRTAISKDASLASEAKTDLEFGKYFEDDTFKTIVK